ncbi:nitronate monooxygenase [Pseudooceanicola sediminis]|uniref:Nitronate monooxygenase n=1 Tax=Pseudooceanicola sediminis TaxID=2211117 RepID=A0A399J0Z8_9RHOB|nr:nitronate monooxygenase [Pseudooceanicola sediminis]KAA2316185.1 nitronate monooxygenase [Puniceibacterium sp. HSS470]RII39098.1 nitronate monooxygenase [Pseudooceanicola sediminis]
MIETRLTRQFGLSVPVVLAPMARVAGGRLAAAVSRAGGLGLIGGGYCDAAWIAEQMDLLRDHAGRAPFGVGLITWALDAVPEVLGQVLAQGPQAVFLSFGDPRPHADAIHAAGARLICQVQDMTGARQALAAGADVIVAQGAEAGGHGAGHGRGRATMTLVPEVVDLVAAERPEVLVLAAGGITDGRGLAAALMLGADGVVCGTRFWAAAEALVPEGQARAALAVDGDATFRSSLVDVARGLDWPAPYDLRGMRNAFSAQWEGRLEALAADPAARAAWAEAAANGDAGIAAPIVGEGIGLIRDAPGAAQIMARMAQEAAQRLGHGARPVGT